MKVSYLILDNPIIQSSFLAFCWYIALFLEEEYLQNLAEHEAAALMLLNIVDVFFT